MTPAKLSEERLAAAKSRDKDWHWDQLTPTDVSLALEDRRALIADRELITADLAAARADNERLTRELADCQQRLASLAVDPMKREELIATCYKAFAERYWKGWALNWEAEPAHFKNGFEHCVDAAFTAGRASLPEVAELERQIAARDRRISTLNAQVETAEAALDHLAAAKGDKLTVAGESIAMADSLVGWALQALAAARGDVERVREFVRLVHERDDDGELKCADPGKFARAVWNLEEIAKEPPTPAKPAASEPASTRHVIRACLTQEPEGGFCVQALNLPGAISQGETEEEALANIKEAAIGVAESYRADGQPIPWLTAWEVPDYSKVKHVEIEIAKNPTKNKSNPAASEPADHSADANESAGDCPHCGSDDTGAALKSPWQRRCATCGTKWSVPHDAEGNLITPADHSGDANEKVEAAKGEWEQIEPLYIGLHDGMPWRAFRTHEDALAWANGQSDRVIPVVSAAVHEAERQAREAAEQNLKATAELLGVVSAEQRAARSPASTDHRALLVKPSPPTPAKRRTSCGC